MFDYDKAISDPNNHVFTNINSSEENKTKSMEGWE